MRPTWSDHRALVAAVCVYPNLVPVAKERSKAAASGRGGGESFPSGQTPTEIKVADVRSAVELGADEIDMVIDRGAFLPAATPRSTTRSCA